MSGIKESEVRLDEALRTALDLRSRIRQTVAETAALMAATRAATGHLSSDEADGVLARIEEACGQAEQTSDEIAHLLEKGTPGLAEVEQARSNAETVLRTVEELGVQVTRVQENLGLTAEVDAALGRLESQAVFIRHWDARHFGALSEQGQSLRNRLGDDLINGAPSSQHRTLLAEFRGLIQSLEASVNVRQRQDDARQHVVGAIEGACARLGYTVEHEPQADPNAPRRFAVNTGCYGVLRFEFSLDAVLRTDCERLQPTICENWVERFEEQMRALGVQMEFRYAASGQPVRRGRTARGVPASPAVHNAQGS